MWKLREWIFVEGDIFRTENEIYEITNVEKFLNKARKRRKIIIYNESVFCKEISFDNCNNVSEKEIDNKIKEEFGVNNNYLFNYDKRNKEKVVNVYAVKSGDIIEALCKDADYINVIPVQLILKKILQKEINKKSWACIVKIRDFYYFISIDKGILKNAIVDKDYREVLAKVINLKEIYIQKGTEFIKSELKNIEKFHYLKGEINEKIIKKQKFYS